MNNINLGLLEVIKCNNYIISTNGSRDNNPNKTTFAWILKNPERNVNEKINFIFNYNNKILQKIFTDDEKKKYNFECIFPEGGKNGYTIEIG